MPVEQAPAEGAGVTMPRGGGRAVWIWGVALVLLATALRLIWVLAVPTVPVSDFAMYRESANYLSEFGSLDSGFIYMPGFVALLAWIKDAGGDLLAQKMPGVAFGGLGAAALYVLAACLVDGARAGRPPRALPAPVATVATALYALWPAGVAAASVVGTDVPAAALVLAALAVLAVLSGRVRLRAGAGPADRKRALGAALAFGAVMGLAAWVRAVALPLTVLGAGIWIARRARWRWVAALTGISLAATLLVLSPWAARHLRQSGELYFTDDHGGITALIGANPNSEGTYTRALNQMFRDLTGKSVLDEPHRQVDRAAYALAREWVRYEPAYALGLGALRAERLYDPEQRLLYWPVFRPGVLSGRPEAFFAARREAIGDFTDAFGACVAALAVAGVVIALARRLWLALALVPFQAALTATYVLFFAEPRYRIPIEMLAFPFVALALVEIATLLAALPSAVRRRDGTGVRRAVSALAAGGAAAWLVCGLAWPSLREGGADLRARHRWAATEWRVDGRARLCKWRPAGALPPVSVIEAGAPGGLRVRAQRQTDAAPSLIAVELGGGDLAAGSYDLGLRLEASGAAPVQLTLTHGVGAEARDTTVTTTAGAVTNLTTTLHHAGGPLRLTAKAESSGLSSLWISEARLDPAR